LPETKPEKIIKKPKTAKIPKPPAKQLKQMQWYINNKDTDGFRFIYKILAKNKSLTTDYLKDILPEDISSRTTVFRLLKSLQSGEYVEYIENYCTQQKIDTEEVFPKKIVDSKKGFVIK
jgi:hypothetical protein